MSPAGKFWVTYLTILIAASLIWVKLVSPGKTWQCGMNDYAGAYYITEGDLNSHKNFVFVIDRSTGQKGLVRSDDVSICMEPTE